MSTELSRLIANDCLVVLLVTVTVVIVVWAAGFIRFLWRDE